MSRPAAAADFPPPSAAAAVAGTIPAAHTFQAGRGISIPKGSSFSVFDSLFGLAQQQQILSVGAPVAVLRAVYAILFNDARPVPDIATAECIALAEQYSLHPDQVRKVAALLFRRWKTREPETLMQSFAVRDPSLPLTARENMTEMVTFNHRTRPPFDASKHRGSLSVDDDYIQADGSNYVYAVRGNPKKKNATPKMVVYSCTSLYSAAALRKFEEQITKLSHLDVDWYRSFAQAMAGRMTPRLVLHICVQAVQWMNSAMRGIGSGDRRAYFIEVFFQREKKQCLLTPGDGPVRLNGPSFIPELDKLEGPAGRDVDPPPVCMQCGVGVRKARCAHCGELRCCTEACMRANWLAVHQAECKVFAKKTRNVAPAPGGAPIYQGSK